MDLLTELTLATNNFGNTRTGSLAGPLGGLIIALLAFGTVLLIRNMNARLRRLPERFGPPAESDRSTPDASAAASGPSDDPDTR